MILKAHKITTRIYKKIRFYLLGGEGVDRAGDDHGDSEKNLKFTPRHF
jgi:hypothetical protein